MMNYGDLAYLLRERYEAGMRALVKRAERLPVRQVSSSLFAQHSGDDPSNAANAVRSLLRQEASSKQV